MNTIKITIIKRDTKELQKNMPNCKTGIDLSPLIQAYNKDKSDHVIFVSQENLEKAENQDKVKFSNGTVLGYVATNKDSGCHARYKLNIHVHGSTELYDDESSDQQGNNEADQDIYIAPDAFKTDNDLYYQQNFYIW